MFEQDQMSGGGDVSPNFVSKYSEMKNKTKEKHAEYYFIKL